MSRIKPLLVITAIIDAMYAVALVFTPDLFLTMHGLDSSASSLFTTRLLAPAVISDCLLALLGLRLLHSQDALRAIAFKTFVSWGIGGIVIALGKLTLPQMSAMAWVDVGFAAIFTVIWAYYFFSPAQRTPADHNLVLRSA